MIRHLLKLIWNRKGQNSFLILEVIFVFLILFAVSTFVIYNLNSYRQPLGFDTKPIWVVYFDAPWDVDSLVAIQANEQIKNAVLNLPEVAAASFAGSITPFSGSNWVSTNDDMGFDLQTWMANGDEDLAKTLGIKMVGGHWPTEADYQGKYTPIVVNKLLVDTYFPDSSMVGKVIKFDGEKLIVGIAEHYKYLGEFSEESPLMISPHFKHDASDLALMIRVKEGVSPEFEASLNKTVTNASNGWDFVIQQLENNRVRTSNEIWAPIIALSAICAFLLVNVAFGLFGVLMYNINRRKPEIGLRLAMGASPRAVVAQFLIELFLITGLGLVVGVFFAVQIPLLKIIDLPLNIYLYSGLVSLGIIFTLVGICTLYPSYVASMIQPATALHEE